MGMWINRYIWGVSPLSAGGAFVAVFSGTALISFFAKNNTLRGVLVILFILEVAYGFATLARLEY